MTQLLRFPSAVKRDSSIAAWMRDRPGELGALAGQWFAVMRGCGDDVLELLHDGHPTACVGDAAFAYVNAFRAHVNVGFFRGAEIPDPGGLLEGTGRFMRHVKLVPGHSVDAEALAHLIATAYMDMQRRVSAELRPMLEAKLVSLRQFLVACPPGLRGARLVRYSGGDLRREGYVALSELEPQVAACMREGLSVDWLYRNAVLYLRVFDGNGPAPSWERLFAELDLAEVRALLDDPPTS